MVQLSIHQTAAEEGTLTPATVGEGATLETTSLGGRRAEARSRPITTLHPASLRSEEAVEVRWRSWLYR